jgi:hypothetical protein
VKRSEKVTQELAERGSTFWTVVGFGVGLAAAGTAAYILVRRRMQQEALEVQQFQLSQNGHLNGSSQAPSSSQPRSSTPVEAKVASEPVKASTKEESTPAVAVAEQGTAAASKELPEGATFLGIVNAKIYYPVGISLDQLGANENEILELIYFITEDEARNQGFSPAK